MTALTVPAEPEFAHESERVVWRCLAEQLPDDAVLLPGLRLSDRSQDREADLVVLWPGIGIAVIEVKGGEIGLARRTWTQTGANGVTRQIHPVDQARVCKYLIRQYLREHPVWRWSDPRMAHLVAFPYTDIPDGFRAPDCDRDRVIGRGDLDRAAAVVRQALDSLVHHPPAPTLEQVEAAVDCLAGQLLAQTDLVGPGAVRLAVAEHEVACDLLTAAQAKVLDLVRLNTRVEILGGAGSGKTWLAVEQARRLAVAGFRVGLLCYSRGLASFLQRRVATFAEAERPAYVGTFHGLGTEWLGAPTHSDDDSDFWERRLPEEMARLAAARPVEERFDAFIVDEAQDFADTWWPALIAALRDEQHGGLFVFADEGQRVFARRGSPPVEMTRILLDENLRNTRQIAGTFDTLAPLRMRCRGGDGVPVRFVPCRTEDALGAADDEAVALLEQGWAPAHIALLSTGRRHPVQTEQQAHGQDRYWQTYWDGTDLFYGHVLGFKGLERPAVVLALNGFRDRDRAPEMLYVGLSRARDLLIVCGDPDEVLAVGGPDVAHRLGIP